MQLSGNRGCEMCSSSFDIWEMYPNGNQNGGKRYFTQKNVNGIGLVII